MPVLPYALRRRMPELKRRDEMTYAECVSEMRDGLGDETLVDDGATT